MTLEGGIQARQPIGSSYSAEILSIFATAELLSLASSAVTIERI
jgi:hypothetical protein